MVDPIPLLTGLGLDAASLAAVLVVYDRRHRSADGVFTATLFNVVTFLLCFVLRRVPIELGFALGLFAVFGVLRYRTEPIRPRELTYYFVVIGLAMLNGVGVGGTGPGELVLVNGIIVATTTLLELLPGRRRGHQYRAGGELLLLYDKITLLAPGREIELYEDLRERTGLHVVAHRIDRVDLLREVAEITIERNGVRR
jgi:hypothetical protein